MNTKQALMAAVTGVFLAGLCVVFLESTPMLQVSYNTKQPVACASKDTDWEIRPASDPVCQQVAKGTADVEWVP